MRIFRNIFKNNYVQYALSIPHWRLAPIFVLQSLHLCVRRQGQTMLALPFARFQGHFNYLQLLSLTVCVSVCVCVNALAFVVECVYLKLC